MLDAMKYRAVFHQFNMSFEQRERRVSGHKKARLRVQPGFFRDPVGIRTPNLLIRSEVLYPVELQSRSTLALRQIGGQR